MARKRPREIANPVKSRLRAEAGGRQVGYISLSTFNARAAPELRVRPPSLSCPLRLAVAAVCVRQSAEAACWAEHVCAAARTKGQV